MYQKFTKTKTVAGRSSTMKFRIIQKNGTNPKSLISKGSMLLFAVLLLSWGKVTAQSIVSNGETKLELIVGEEHSLLVRTTPGGQSVAWKSSDESKAIVEGDGYNLAKVIAKTAGTVNINATVNGQTVTFSITIYSPSQSEVTINGITWATRNVDAPGTFAAKISDTGMFYQWNRKTGWSTTNQQHTTTSSPPGRSWDNSVPAGTSWEAANDPCPAGWRVPTYEELDKLQQTSNFREFKHGLNVSRDYISSIVNGVRGFKFGNGSNTVFLPMMPAPSHNYRYDYFAYYWSAIEYGRDMAWYLEFQMDVNKSVIVQENPSGNLRLGGTARSSAHCIRCVKK